MKAITDIEKQNKHLKKCAFELNSKVEWDRFKEYILKEYKHPWHTLDNYILVEEKYRWYTERRTEVYDFELLGDF